MLALFQVLREFGSVGRSRGAAEMTTVVRGVWGSKASKKVTCCDFQEDETQPRTEIIY